jgi:hypothetical protein
MRLTGTCPKCQSLEIVRSADRILGGGEYTDIALSNGSSVNAPWYACSRCGYPGVRVRGSSTDRAIVVRKSFCANRVESAQKELRQSEVSALLFPSFFGPFARVRKIVVRDLDRDRARSARGR